MACAIITIKQVFQVYQLFYDLIHANHRYIWTRMLVFLNVVLVYYYRVD